MVSEVRVTVDNITGVPTSTPTNYLFEAYLVQAPATAATTATAQGLTWTRSSPACNGAGAVMYAPGALQPGDTRAQLWVMIAG